MNKAYTQIKQEEAKTENTIASLEESNDKSNDEATKPSKTLNNDYFKGFADGWMFVLDSMRCGKSLKDLQSELAKLKDGRESVEDLSL